MIPSYLHLPADVLFSIPLTNFANSPVDDPPATWQQIWSNTAVTVAGFMYHAFIDRQFISTLVATVVVLGLHKIAEMYNAVSQWVKDAVDKIVEAFNAFIDWLVDTIVEALKLVLAPIKAVFDSIGNYINNIGAVAARASLSVDSGALTNSEACTLVANAILLSEVFTILMVALTALSLALTHLSR